MLAEFAILLALGLCAVVPLVIWDSIPSGFFRTQAAIVVALLVLAAVDLFFGGAPPMAVAATAAGAVVAYLAMVAAMLDKRHAATVLFAIDLVGLMSGIAASSFAGRVSANSAIELASRWASAGVIGATLSAMLLGHYYLTAPRMTIAPLLRLIGLAGGALAGRSILAALSLGSLLSVSTRAPDPLFLGMRWLMGVVGAGIALFLAWRTARIRSTQSATGILYIAVTLVLFGELTALNLHRALGILV